MLEFLLVLKGLKDEWVLKIDAVDHLLFLLYILVIGPQCHNFIVILVKIKVFLLNFNGSSLLMSFWRFRLSMWDAVKHL